MWRWKWTTVCLYGYRMSVSGSVVYLHGGSCWVGSAACHPTQYQERGLYHIGLTQERITTHNLNCGFSWMCITFSPWLKLKNHKLNQVKSGTVCTCLTHILCLVKILKKLKVLKLQNVWTLNYIFKIWKHVAFSRRFSENCLVFLRLTF